MKNILTISLFLSCFFHAFGQNVKRQIGTTVWHNEKGELIADSSIAIIIDYDKEGYKTKEWQVFRDSIGGIMDTNYAIVNRNDQQLLLYAKKCFLYTEYDALGARTKVVRVCNKDTTLHLEYELAYNKNNKLDSIVQRQLRTTYKTSPIVYKYRHKRRKMYRTGENISEIYKYDRFGKLKFIQVNLTNYEKKQVIEYVTQRNRRGQKVKYKRSENSQLQKETFHFYKDDLEVKRVEYYFNPTYTATTTFIYEYY